MAKVSVKKGDFSLVRFLAAGFDLFLARIDGRNENRETIGKRYIISNAMLNKFADFMAEYSSNKGIENGGAVIPDDMVCFSEKAQEFVNDEKRRNKGRKAMEGIRYYADQLREIGYSEEEIKKMIGNDTIE